jgi:hypothetical protein
MRYADYAQQAELLKRLHEKRGDDVYVAIYDLFRKSPDAELTSFSSWAGGIVSLLPRCDVIGFAEDEQAQPFIVPWEAAERIVGHLMVETGDYPPRYRVEEFPTKAEIAKLKEFAL